MTTDVITETAAAVEAFAQIWKDAIVFVLGQVSGEEWTSAAAIAETPAPEPDSTIDISFHVGGKLPGELAFQLAKPNAVRLTQLLMSEPQDASIPFADSHVDALKEIFRQFAGRVATACKAKYGGETPVELQDKATLEWKPDCRVAWTTAGKTGDPIAWSLLFSPKLKVALETTPDKAQTSQPAQAPPPPPSAPAKAQETPSPVAPSAPAASAAPVFSPPEAIPSVSAAPVQPEEPDTAGSGATSARNIDLLLDVELDATLRFGQREMLLKDILALRPGSVVELDRRVQEPAELLVAGRVIARGDVVIVDGNYGIRITDIAQPRDRLQSFET